MAVSGGIATHTAGNNICSFNDLSVKDTSGLFFSTPQANLTLHFRISTYMSMKIGFGRGRGGGSGRYSPGLTLGAFFFFSLSI